MHPIHTCKHNQQTLCKFTLYVQYVLLLEMIQINMVIKHETYMEVLVLQGVQGVQVVLEDQLVTLLLYPCLPSLPHLLSDPSPHEALQCTGLKNKKKANSPKNRFFELACISLILFSSLNAVLRYCIDIMCCFTWWTCLSLRPRITYRTVRKKKMKGKCYTYTHTAICLHTVCTCGDTQWPYFTFYSF